MFLFYDGRIEVTCKKQSNFQITVVLRILTWKKHPKIKLQRLRKIQMLTFGSLVHQINSFQEVLKLEQIFQKKLHSLWSVHFVVAILFVLTLGTDRAVLNGNGVFPILLASTKKCYSSFLKKVFIFPKICFKVKVLKTFETFTDCHIKTCRSLKPWAILKIPSTVFLEEPMLFLLALK